MGKNGVNINGVTDRFLAYVQRFDIIPQPKFEGSAERGPYPEPASSLYLLKRGKRANGEIIGDIVPLNQIRALADVPPRFGAKANCTLSKENSHSVSTEFRLNKYFDKEMFLAMTLVED